MNKFLLASLGLAVTFSGLAFGADSAEVTPSASSEVSTVPVVTALTASIYGENSNTNLSLVASAKNLKDAINAQDAAKAKQNLVYVKALLGSEDNTQVKTETTEEVSRGWFRNTVTAKTTTLYTVSGLKSLENNDVVAIEAVFSALGFGYAEFANTNLVDKKECINMYLLAVGSVLDTTIDMKYVKEYTTQYIAKFATVAKTRAAGQLTANALAGVLAESTADGVKEALGKSFWTKGRVAAAVTTFVAINLALAHKGTPVKGNVSFAWRTK